MNSVVSLAQNNSRLFQIHATVTEVEDPREVILKAVKICDSSKCSCYGEEQELQYDAVDQEPCCRECGASLTYEVESKRKYRWQQFVTIVDHDARDLAEDRTTRATSLAVLEDEQTGILKPDDVIIAATTTTVILKPRQLVGSFCLRYCSN